MEPDVNPTPAPAVGGPAMALMAAIANDLRGYATELTEQYRAAAADYGTVVSDAFEENTAAVLQMAFHSLTDPTYTTSLDDLRLLVTEWGAQGIPLELVAHRLQVGARRLMEVARDRANEFGVSADDIAQAQDFAWQWATEHAAVIYEVHQERALAQASSTADFMRRLLAGTMPQLELRTMAPRLRLDLDTPYVVACVRWGDARTLSDLRSRLRVQGGTSKLPVVDAVVDGTHVALLPQSPPSPTAEASVGISQPRPLNEVGTSYDEALRALQIAETFDLNGIHGLGDLGALPLLATAADDAAALLDDRHLQPLRAQGRAAEEILATVGAYLRYDRRVEECARALMVHRNTVRYRLTRFTEVTGLDPEHTSDLVVIWWLLNRTKPAPE
ncbi:PucR family transcriptional regulator [Nocardioides jejuensis]|uniref:PucR family transcriptional regulator n=1 Tax=Nocardioides jejuensis TaxID=2502782 RepID=A0A4R1CH96_9ACTN|nr:helix-turn-helix domain-containing protein [Nocardioides jejuensis]TCJ30630.1 PucR family transcriptional regulator [Nocardioides jejuensis]